MTLQIIGFSRSNFVRTVRMAAHEKGVAYEHIPERPHSDAVKAIHPLGLIPAMRHDGLTLFESMAIAHYIDARFEGPRLIPADPAKAAVVNQWCSFVQTAVDHLLMRHYVVEYLFHKDEEGAVIRTRIDKAIKRFPRMFGTLDAAVAGGFLGGTEFSLADCFLAPILASVTRFPEGEAAAKSHANLSTWFERMAQRQSFVETET